MINYLKTKTQKQKKAGFPCLDQAAKLRFFFKMVCSGF